MTATAAQPTATVEARKPLGKQLVRIMTTTDHKLIGKLYLITAMVWFVLAGVMALIMRAGTVLARAPGW